MTNKEKAKLISEQFHCDDVAYDAAEQMAEWKEQQMIDKACEFIAEWFYEHPHAPMVCSDEFETVDKLLDRFKKAMEGGEE